MLNGEDSTMRALIAFTASLVAALVLAERGTVQRVVTGSVGEYAAGDWISIANETTDHSGV
jgi:hypothetical protein